MILVRFSLIAVAAVALAGCAATPQAPPPTALQLLLNSPPASPPATNAEVDAAVRASNYCMWKATAALDDGVSPANVIGNAVVEQCSAQLNHEAFLDAQGLSVEESESMMQESKKIWPSIATNIVLRYRVAKRQASPAG